MRHAMSAIAPALCAIGVACTEVETQQSSTSSPQLTTTPRRLELPASGVGTMKLLSRIEPVVQVFTSLGSGANFLLDTGASEVFLSPEQALKWRLSVQEMSAVSLYSASDAVSTDRHAVIPSLFLGVSVAKNVDAFVLDNVPPDFGGVIGLVGCYKGYNAGRGTESVGIAANSAVVLSSLLVIIVDMIAVQITDLL